MEAGGSKKRKRSAAEEAAFDGEAKTILRTYLNNGGYRQFEPLPSQKVKPGSSTPYSDAIAKPGGSKSKKKTDGRTKRPMNPFMTFAQTVRNKILEDAPNSDNSRLSVLLGKVWKSLPVEEEDVWKDEYKRLLELFHIQNPLYKYEPRKKQKQSPSALAAVRAPVVTKTGRVSKPRHSRLETLPGSASITPPPGSDDVTNGSSDDNEVIPDFHLPLTPADDDCPPKKKTKKASRGGSVAGARRPKAQKAKAVSPSAFTYPPPAILSPSAPTTANSGLSAFRPVVTVNNNNVDEYQDNIDDKFIDLPDDFDLIIRAAATLPPTVESLEPSVRLDSLDEAVRSTTLEPAVRVGILDAALKVESLEPVARIGSLSFSAKMQAELDPRFVWVEPSRDEVSMELFSSDAVEATARELSLHWEESLRSEASVEPSSCSDVVEAAKENMPGLSNTNNTISVQEEYQASESDSSTPHRKTTKDVKSDDPDQVMVVFRKSVLNEMFSYNGGTAVKTICYDHKGQLHHGLYIMQPSRFILEHASRTLGDCHCGNIDPEEVPIELMFQAPLTIEEPSNDYEFYLTLSRSSTTEIRQ